MQKLLYWIGNSLEAVKLFSVEARREAGHQLGRVQDGKEPTDWKPMETVGAGVREIRIHAENGYRVFVVCREVRRSRLCPAWFREKDPAHAEPILIWRTSGIEIC
jgi:phage-related protein